MLVGTKFWIAWVQVPCSRGVPMKRSEAINLIANFVYHLNVDYRECDIVANKLLTKLEDAGMIPPPVQGKYDPVPTVTPTGNHDYSLIREWEPEND